MSRLELKFKSDLCKLIGNPFGRQTYDEQAKGKIDLSNSTCIVLPDRIKRVGSSFIQGFFHDIVKQIGISGVEEKFEFESSISDFKQFVIKSLQ